MSVSLDMVQPYIHAAWMAELTWRKNRAPRCEGVAQENNISGEPTMERTTNTKMKAVQRSLFDDKDVVIQAKKSKRALFEDYDAFLAKFNAEAPKTTDECYTPQPVYDAVLEWLRGQVDIEDRPIIRPFFPGGDYKNYEYPENCVVVDNPPFSILAQILRFYQATGIDYFLFAPGLSLFGTSPDGDCNVVAGTQIIYANKAKVLTGFHTSLFPGVKVMIAGTLNRAITQSHRAPSAPRRVYSKNVITSALLHKVTRSGDVMIYDNEVAIAKSLDVGVDLFGGGI